MTYLVAFCYLLFFFLAFMRQWPAHDAQFVEALRCHPEISMQKWAEMLHKALLLPSLRRLQHAAGGWAARAAKRRVSAVTAPVLPGQRHESSASLIPRGAALQIRKTFPNLVYHGALGAFLPHGKQQTCKGHPALGQLSLDCWALLVIGLLGLLLISEILVEILQ